MNNAHGEKDYPDGKPAELIEINKKILNSIIDELPTSTIHFMEKGSRVDDTPSSNMSGSSGNENQSIHTTNDVHKQHIEKIGKGDTLVPDKPYTYVRSNEINKALKKKNTQDLIRDKSIGFKEQTALELLQSHVENREEHVETTNEECVDSVEENGGSVKNLIDGAGDTPVSEKGCRTESSAANMNMGEGNEKLEEIIQELRNCLIEEWLLEIKTQDLLKAKIALELLQCRIKNSKESTEQECVDSIDGNGGSVKYLIDSAGDTPVSEKGCRTESSAANMNMSDGATNPDEAIKDMINVGETTQGSEKSCSAEQHDKFLHFSNYMLDEQMLENIGEEDSPGTNELLQEEACSINVRKTMGLFNLANKTGQDLFRPKSVISKDCKSMQLHQAHQENCTDGNRIGVKDLKTGRGHPEEAIKELCNCLIYKKLLEKAGSINIRKTARLFKLNKKKKKMSFNSKSVGSEEQKPLNLHQTLVENSIDYVETIKDECIDRIEEKGKRAIDFRYGGGDTPGSDKSEHAGHSKETFNLSNSIEDQLLPEKVDERDNLSSDESCPHRRPDETIKEILCVNSIDKNVIRGKDLLNGGGDTPASDKSGCAGHPEEPNLDEGGNLVNDKYCLVENTDEKIKEIRNYLVDKLPLKQKEIRVQFMMSDGGSTPGAENSCQSAGYNIEHEQHKEKVQDGNTLGFDNTCFNENRRQAVEEICSNFINKQPPEKAGSINVRKTIRLFKLANKNKKDSFISKSVGSKERKALQLHKTQLEHHVDFIDTIEEECIDHIEENEIRVIDSIYGVGDTPRAEKSCQPGNNYVCDEQLTEKIDSYNCCCGENGAERVKDISNYPINEQILQEDRSNNVREIIRLFDCGNNKKEDLFISVSAGLKDSKSLQLDATHLLNSVDVVEFIEEAGIDRIEENGRGDKDLIYEEGDTFGFDKSVRSSHSEESVNVSNSVVDPLLLVKVDEEDNVRSDESCSGGNTNETIKESRNHMVDRYSLKQKEIRTKFIMNDEEDTPGSAKSCQAENICVASEQRQDNNGEGNTFSSDNSCLGVNRRQVAKETSSYLMNEQPLEETGSVNVRKIINMFNLASKKKQDIVISKSIGFKKRKSLQLGQTHLETIEEYKLRAKDLIKEGGVTPGSEKSTDHSEESDNTSNSIEDQRLLEKVDETDNIRCDASCPDENNDETIKESLCIDSMEVNVISGKDLINGGVDTAGSDKSGHAGHSEESDNTSNSIEYQLLLDKVDETDNLSSDASCSDGNYDETIKESLSIDSMEVNVICGNDLIKGGGDTPGSDKSGHSGHSEESDSISNSIEYQLLLEKVDETDNLRSDAFCLDEIHDETIKESLSIDSMEVNVICGKDLIKGGGDTPGSDKSGHAGHSEESDNISNSIEYQLLLEKVDETDNLSSDASCSDGNHDETIKESLSIDSMEVNVICGNDLIKGGGDTPGSDKSGHAGHSEESDSISNSIKYQLLLEKVDETDNLRSDAFCLDEIHDETIKESLSIDSMEVNVICGNDLIKGGGDTPRSDKSGHAGHSEESDSISNSIEYQLLLEKVDETDNLRSDASCSDGNHDETIKESLCIDSIEVNVICGNDLIKGGGDTPRSDKSGHAGHSEESDSISKSIEYQLLLEKVDETDNLRSDASCSDGNHDETIKESLCIDSIEVNVICGNDLIKGGGDTPTSDKSGHAGHSEESDSISKSIEYQLLLEKVDETDNLRSDAFCLDETHDETIKESLCIDSMEVNVICGNDLIKGGGDTPRSDKSGHAGHSEESDSISNSIEYQLLLEKVDETDNLRSDASCPDGNHDETIKESLCIDSMEVNVISDKDFINGGGNTPGSDKSGHAGHSEESDSISNSIEYQLLLERVDETDNLRSDAFCLDEIHDETIKESLCIDSMEVNVICGNDLIKGGGDTPGSDNSGHAGHSEESDSISNSIEYQLLLEKVDETDNLISDASCPVENHDEIIKESLCKDSMGGGDTAGSDKSGRAGHSEESDNISNCTIDQRLIAKVDEGNNLSTDECCPDENPDETNKKVQKQKEIRVKFMMTDRGNTLMADKSCQTEGNYAVHEQPQDQIEDENTIGSDNSCCGGNRAEAVGEICNYLINKQPLKKAGSINVRTIRLFKLAYKNKKDSFNSKSVDSKERKALHRTQVVNRVDFIETIEEDSIYGGGPTSGSDKSVRAGHSEGSDYISNSMKYQLLLEKVDETDNLRSDASCPVENHDETIKESLCIDSMVVNLISGKDLINGGGDTPRSNRSGHACHSEESDNICNFTIDQRLIAKVGEGNNFSTDECSPDENPDETNKKIQKQKEIRVKMMTDRGNTRMADKSCQTEGNYTVHELPQDKIEDENTIGSDNSCCGGNRAEAVGEICNYLINKQPLKKAGSINVRKTIRLFKLAYKNKKDSFNSKSVDSKERKALQLHRTQVENRVDFIETIEEDSIYGGGPTSGSDKSVRAGHSEESDSISNSIEYQLLLEKVDETDNLISDASCPVENHDEIIKESLCKDSMGGGDTAGSDKSGRAGHSEESDNISNCTIDQRLIAKVDEGNNLSTDECCPDENPDETNKKIQKQKEIRVKFMMTDRGNTRMADKSCQTEGNYAVHEQPQDKIEDENTIGSDNSCCGGNRAVAVGEICNYLINKQPLKKAGSINVRKTIRLFKLANKNKKDSFNSKSVDSKEQKALQLHQTQVENRVDFIETIEEDCIDRIGENGIRVKDSIYGGGDTSGSDKSVRAGDSEESVNVSNSAIDQLLLEKVDELDNVRSDECIPGGEANEIIMESCNHLEGKHALMQKEIQTNFIMNDGGDTPGAAKSCQARNNGNNGEGNTHSSDNSCFGENRRQAATESFSYPMNEQPLEKVVSVNVRKMINLFNLASKKKQDIVISKSEGFKKRKSLQLGLTRLETIEEECIDSIEEIIIHSKDLINGGSDTSGSDKSSHAGRPKESIDLSNSVVNQRLLEKVDRGGNLNTDDSCPGTIKESHNHMLDRHPLKQKEIRVEFMIDDGEDTHRAEQSCQAEVKCVVGEQPQIKIGEGNTRGPDKSCLCENHGKTVKEICNHLINEQSLEANVGETISTKDLINGGEDTYCCDKDVRSMISVVRLSITLKQDVFQPKLVGFSENSGEHVETTEQKCMDSMKGDGIRVGDMINDGGGTCRAGKPDKSILLNNYVLDEQPLKKTGKADALVSEESGIPECSDETIEKLCKNLNDEQPLIEAVPTNLQSKSVSCKEQKSLQTRPAHLKISSGHIETTEEECLDCICYIVPIFHMTNNDDQTSCGRVPNVDATANQRKSYKSRTTIRKTEHGFHIMNGVCSSKASDVEALE